MEIEIFGWLGSAFFAICSLPQAIKAIRDKHASGVSFWYLVLWFFGEIFMLVYVWDMKDWPLIVNYVMNMIFLLIIGGYKLFPRHAKT